MKMDTRSTLITRMAVGVALSVASLAAAAQDTTYTLFIAEGTAPANNPTFSPADDVNNVGEVVGTNFTWVPPGEPTLVEPPIDRFGAILPINAINDLGVGTGGAAFPDGRFSLFTLENGVTTNLGTGGNQLALGNDINNLGEIVGNVRPRNTRFNRRAFIFRDGEFTDLGSLNRRTDDPATDFASALAVNNNSEVVGEAANRRGLRRAFRWSNGRMINLGSLGRGGRSVANGINDQGVIVGRSDVNRRGLVQRAFVWRNRATGMQDLGALDGTASAANDINNAGVIVGSFRSTVRVGFESTENHAAVWIDGEGTDLNAPGVVTNLPDDITLEVANAVNDDGVIVGITCSRQCAPGKSRFGRPFALIPNN